MQDLIGQHVRHTGSALGARLLHDWADTARRFVKVMPRDYKRVLSTSQFFVAAPAAVAVTANVASGLGRTLESRTTTVASGLGGTLESAANGVSRPGSWKSFV